MKKILLALDCSDHSEKAASYVTEVVPHLPGCEIVLFTTLSGIPYGSQRAPVAEAEGDTPETHGDEDHDREIAEARTFQAAVAKRLEEAGFPMERVERVLIPERRGVAQDIADAAEEYGCSTIVVGRRGLSKVRELLGGSVSQGILQKSRAMTVWIVE